jgi:hypothetical protein
MTDTEAKKILGFPASARPTPEEVELAYKPLAIKFHPDRPTGDLDKMKQLNRARDVLKKAPPPRMERGAPPGGWRPEDKVKKEAPPTVKTIPGENFNQGTQVIPSNVEWKFISKPIYAQNKDKRSFYSDVWTLVGVTDSKWVVVGLQWRHENSYLDTDLGGVVKVEPSWEANMVSANRGLDPVKTLPKLIKNVSVLFTDGTISDPPKKFVAWEGGQLTEALVRKVKSGSGGASLKDILIGTKLVSESAAGLGGRKTVVEMWTKYSIERRKRMSEKKGLKLTNADVYDFFVRVNGHEYKLADDTIETLDKKGFFFAVFKYDFGEGAPKQLNKIRGGRFGAGADVVITLLADCLTSEPSSLQIALQKAAEEWAPEATAASIIERFEFE